MRDQTGRTKSILVIDDEPMVLQLLKTIFELEGYEVNLAADGASGMALLRETKPDIVLLDILMPGLNGYQVLGLIRQHSNVPVIVVTGNIDVNSLQKALALGADDYVRKPFRPLELMARVRAKLRRTENEVSAIY